MEKKQKKILADLEKRATEVKPAPAPSAPIAPQPKVIAAPVVPEEEEDSVY